MTDEKKIFFEKCSKKDQEKLLGKRKMTFDDFERFIFLTEYFGYMEYKKEIFNCFIPQFKEKYTELIELWKAEDEGAVPEEIDEDIIKRDRWLKSFLGKAE